MIEPQNQDEYPVERILRETLAEARQGKIRSVLLVTMHETGGVGYGASLNAPEDYQASFEHLHELEQQLRDLPQHPN
ncbi:MAG: hypothetical protein JO316_01125 [Abitibacteriaceae bacterium]|nr:hypothetical protein [Abditibacteriaceae bacterium]